MCFFYKYSVINDSFFGTKAEKKYSHTNCVRIAKMWLRAVDRIVIFQNKNLN